MTYAVVVSEQAAREIEESAEWWSLERSPEQAERWYVGIRSAIFSLTERPERHPYAAENSDFDFDLRELLYGLGSRPTHRVLFAIVKRTVVVLAVRHAAQYRLKPDDV